MAMADTLLPKLSLLSQSKVACLCCTAIRSSLRLLTGMNKMCRDGFAAVLKCFRTTSRLTLSPLLSKHAVL